MRLATLAFCEHNLYHSKYHQTYFFFVRLQTNFTRRKLTTFVRPNVLDNNNSTICWQSRKKATFVGKYAWPNDNLLQHLSTKIGPALSSEITRNPLFLCFLWVFLLRKILWKKFTQTQYLFLWWKSFEKNLIKHNVYFCDEKLTVRLPKLQTFSWGTSPSIPPHIAPEIFSKIWRSYQ